MNYISDESIDVIHKAFGYVRGGPSSKHLSGILCCVQQDKKLRAWTPLHAPHYLEVVDWLDTRCQSKSFRARWRRLAKKYSPLKKIVFVRIVGRQGLNATPAITWQWADKVGDKRQVLKT